MNPHNNREIIHTLRRQETTKLKLETIFIVLSDLACGPFFILYPISIGNERNGQIPGLTKGDWII